MTTPWNPDATDQDYLAAAQIDRCPECGSPDPEMPCDYCADVARNDSGKESK